MLLHHGTTLARAKSILAYGPDPDFQEPGELTKAEGFSTARPGSTALHGKPADVAAGKTVIFPEDGGAAIIEVDVPDDIVRLSLDVVEEVRFLPGAGLEELLKVWPTLPKRLIELP